jgi:hypothetical protein
MPPAGLTLYVVHTDRDPDIAADAVSAARWTSAHTCAVALVVGAGKSVDYAAAGADTLYESLVPPAANLADFRFLDGLRQAIHAGVEFEQAFCFRDDAMFLGAGVDTVIRDLIYKENCAFAGVADRNYYGDHFMRVNSHFSKWRVPHEVWDRPPVAHTAQSAVFTMTYKLAREMFYRNLLTPPGLEEWPVSVGAYLTWVCQLLMLPPYLRGSMDRPHAPFYLNDGWGGSYNAPPYILHPSMLVYWSLRRVAGYAEADNRSWCKSLRQVNT